MDFFERAHVPRKSSSKMEKKTDEAVKRQLKQMMHAYKKGNNQGIRNSSELKPKYDLIDTISTGDFSEFSVNKDADNIMDTATSSASDDLQSTTNENNSSKSNTPETDERSQEDSLEDLAEYCEDFNDLSTLSVDVSASNSFGNSSAVIECSDSIVSEDSIINSLQTSTSSGTDVSDDEEFDADGALASKILENLGKKDNACKKRRMPMEKIVLELKKQVEKQKNSKYEENKKQKKTKKPKQETRNSSTEYFQEEEFSSENESSRQNQIVKQLDNDIIIKETKKNKKQLHQRVDLSDDSFNNDSSDSVSTTFSSPFISISADDMSSQSLSDLLGGYVHPTIRNLHTDKQNIIPTRYTSSMFPADTMILQDVIDDEISSLIPEVDEELAIEDLNLDTDTQELIDESNAFNDIIPSDDMMETDPVEDMTADTIHNDDTTIEDEEVAPIKLYNGKDKYILVMKHPAELHVHGKLQVADINGRVEIFGYKLNYDSVEVYAPYCQFAQCLKTLENPHPVNPDLHSELTLAGISVTEANEIVSSIEENSAVIILSKLNNRKLDFVDNNFNAVDIFSKRGDTTPRFLKKAAERLGCSFYLRPPKRSFEGTGKSTFVRHYVNTLLSVGPVLVIDLDPGQAEMLHIGIINTMDNAKRYLSAVSDLITSCRANERFRELPWIVNTMGLCNHMGLKFMTYIILQIEPTFLFQIHSKVPKKRFDVELDPVTITQLYEDYSNERSFQNVQSPHSLKYLFVIARHEENSLAKGGSVGSGLQPRDERYLNILAYFG
ncbi:Polynucleotide 5'-hydroxyl-kinase NOL9, partial [Operophtera brumata]